MSTQTFKSARSTQELSVVKASGNNVRLMYCMEGMADRAIDLASTDIPALCLAVLEAAGYTEDDRKDSDSLYVTDFAVAMIKLADGIEAQERAIAEAREQAELEALALELFNIGVTSGTNRQSPHESFDHIPDYAQPKWLAVARRARELAQEGK